MDDWKPNQIENMFAIGNIKSTMYYESNKPEHVKKPSELDPIEYVFLYIYTHTHTHMHACISLLPAMYIIVTSNVCMDDACIHTYVCVCACLCASTNNNKRKT